MEGYDTRNQYRGFTLIEISVVLVIIGLIVGGVLVGQNLIAAAAVRAQITQVEKFNQAANAFYGKYGYLPGDIPDPAASSFGFQSRGLLPGEGDGNGLIESSPNSVANSGLNALVGEEAMFWVDLSQVQMIEGGFNTASPSSTFGGGYGGPIHHGGGGGGGGGVIDPISGLQIPLYLPQAKIGNGGYVYVWSGGWQELSSQQSPGDSINYFGLAAVTGADQNAMYGLPVIGPAQAYAIDKKMDDGFPQSGRVIAVDASIYWAAGGSTSNTDGFPEEGNTGDYSQANFGPVTSSGDIADGTAVGPNSCYDGGTPGNYKMPEQYSLNQSGGNNINCALSFRMQAGD